MSLVATIAHAALFTLFLWWFATGAILYLDGLPRRTFKLSMGAATAALVVALHVLWATQNDASPFGAYVAFTCALVAWGWNEMAFLMSYLTGPRRTPCPLGASGLDRLRYAAETVLWHEIAIAVTALVLFVLTADAPNRVGFQAFAILWVLRLSAKANVYLGVRNLSEEFLPAHLAYLTTYFRRRETPNPLFPFAITLMTLMAAVFGMRALADGATPFEVTAATLLATLTALALLEHWLMVMPISATVLWRWGLSSRDPASAAPSEPLSDMPAGQLAVAPVPPTIVPFPIKPTRNVRWRRP